MPRITKATLRNEVRFLSQELKNARIILEAYANDNLATLGISWIDTALEHSNSLVKPLQVSSSLLFQDNQAANLDSEVEPVLKQYPHFQDTRCAICEGPVEYAGSDLCVSCGLEQMERLADIRD